MRRERAEPEHRRFRRLLDGGRTFGPELLQRDDRDPQVALAYRRHHRL